MFRFSKRQYRGKTWQWKSLCCRQEPPTDVPDESPEVTECTHNRDPLPEDNLTPVTPSRVDLEERFDFGLNKPAGVKRTKKSKVEQNPRDMCENCDNNYWRRRKLNRSRMGQYKQ